MAVIDIIILVLFLLCNIAAIITFNLTTAKAQNTSKKDRIKASCLFVFAGLIYWIVIAFNSIRYRINNKNK